MNESLVAFFLRYKSGGDGNGHQLTHPNSTTRGVIYEPA